MATIFKEILTKIKKICLEVFVQYKWHC